MLEMIGSSRCLIHVMTFMGLPGLLDGFLRVKPTLGPMQLRDFQRRVRCSGGWGLEGLQNDVKSRVSRSPSAMALGVDYGTVRVGTAAMAGWSPRRLFAIEHTGSDLAVARRLVGLVRSEDANVVVVGMPLDKDGTETKQAQLTRAFARLLASVLAAERNRQSGDFPRVVLVDERSPFSPNKRANGAIDQWRYCVHLSDSWFIIFSNVGQVQLEDGSSKPSSLAAAVQRPARRRSSVRYSRSVL